MYMSKQGMSPLRRILVMASAVAVPISAVAFTGGVSGAAGPPHPGFTTSRGILSACPRGSTTGDGAAPGSSGVDDPNLAELVFIVLSGTTNDQNNDLEQVMAEIQALTAVKAFLRC